MENGRSVTSEQCEEPFSIADLDKPVNRSAATRSRCKIFHLQLFFSVIFTVLNIAAVIFSIITINRKFTKISQSQLSGPPGPVSPLCMACEDVKDVSEMIMYSSDNADVCCPAGHRQTAEVLDQIYTEALEEKMEEFFKNQDESYSSLVFLSVPEGVSETIWQVNRVKPAGHVTGIQKMNAEEFYSLSRDDKAADLQVVGDWPLRVEPYRSVTIGYVQRLTWGLSVPATGLYRAHTSVNFYFRSDNGDSSGQAPPSTIPVIHQLSRYQLADRKETLLVERNHTIASSHSDGVNSFLVTLALLHAGDVVYVSVSHPVAMGMQERWHSEGLVLVE